MLDGPHQVMGHGYIFDNILVKLILLIIIYSVFWYYDYILLLFKNIFPQIYYLLNRLYEQ